MNLGKYIYRTTYLSIQVQVQVSSGTEAGSGQDLFWHNSSSHKSGLHGFGYFKRLRARSCYTNRIGRTGNFTGNILRQDLLLRFI